MLTPDRWERVKDLFDRALDSAPGARVGLLESECGNDPEVFAEVQRLLEQWEAAGEFLANPIGDLSVPTERSPGFAEGDVVAQRFRIVRLIGTGGMGEVYEAEDQDLGERVALKTVRIDRIGDPMAQRRLRREALLARRVTHPNVCRIFDVGRHVSPHDGSELAILSMELLAGQTLAARLKERGRLTEAEALPIVEQMCAALEAAHTAGVVHRDFKPSNVMLVGDRVVVTDFGLALSDRRAGKSWPSGTTLTHSGQLMGTPEYMAPEQIRTGEATPRSDIYSLGVVMYEMVTGVRPAAGSTGIDEILKRFLEPVRPPREVCPGLSRRWEAVILRCLEREAEKRPASVAEVTVECKQQPDSRDLFPMNCLQWVRAAKISWPVYVAAAAAVIFMAASGTYLNRDPLQSDRSLSLAVIPFEPVGPSPTHQYLADGLTDELISRLERIPSLRVPGRGSSYRFQGRDLQAPEIAQQLNVRWLLYGRLRVGANKTQLAVRLVDAKTTSEIWNRDFEAGSDELVRLGGRISDEVASQLRVSAQQDPSLTQQSRAANSLAYDLFLRGRYHWNRRDPEDQRKAMAMFEKAIDIDPNYAAAHCGLAEVLASLADVNQMPPAEALPRAKLAALRAIELNGQFGHAHATFGSITALWDLDWATAERSFQRAIQLDPHDLYARIWYSHLLMKLGRANDSMEQAEHAVRMDPLSTRALFNLGSMSYFNRRYPLAEESLRKVQRQAPDMWVVHELLAETYARMGRRDEALKEITRALENSRMRGHALTYAANAMAILNEPLIARKYIDQLLAEKPNPKFQPFHVARAYAQIGDSQKAFEWLEIARSERDPGIHTSLAHHSLDSIRRDPRFAAFVDHMRIAVPKPTTL